MSQYIKPKKSAAGCFTGFIKMKKKQNLTIWTVNSYIEWAKWMSWQCPNNHT